VAARSPQHARDLIKPSIGPSDHAFLVETAMSASRVRAKTERAKSSKPAKPSKPPKPIDLDQLLFSRSQVCRLLGGVHVATVIRLEQSGKLPPVKLTPADQGRTYYRRADVMALAEGSADA
jgi:hypothetical protein